MALSRCSYPTPGPPAPERLAVTLLLIAAVLLGGCAQLRGLRALDPRAVLAPRGSVTGQVRIGRSEVTPALGPAVVYLTRAGGSATPSPREHTVRYRDGAPATPLAALGPADTIRFVSEDAIHHRLFALSTRAAAIEIGLAPRATSRSVRPRASGVHRFYCELHEDESFLVFVSPSPHFSVVDRRGRYAMADVPRGAWRLHVWSERIPGSVREITVDGRGAEQTIWLDARSFRTP